MPGHFVAKRDSIAWQGKEHVQGMRASLPGPAGPCLLWLGICSDMLRLNSCYGPCCEGGNGDTPPLFQQLRVHGQCSACTLYELGLSIPEPMMNPSMMISWLYGSVYLVPAHRDQSWPYTTDRFGGMADFGRARPQGPACSAATVDSEQLEARGVHPNQSISTCWIFEYVTVAMVFEGT